MKSSTIVTILHGLLLEETSSMSYFSANSSKKRTVQADMVDVRFGPTPFCGCKKKAAIKVVESETKMSKGKLYYSCPMWKCNFFAWVKAEEVNLKGNQLIREETRVSFVEEEEEAGEEVISGYKDGVIPHKGRNYVHISWVVVVAFYFFFLSVAMKM